MFKFRKKKITDVVIRAEELRVGDRFVYDNPVEVLDIHRADDRVIARLGLTDSGTCRTRTVGIFNELKIIVPR